MDLSASQKPKKPRRVSARRALGAFLCRPAAVTGRMVAYSSSVSANSSFRAIAVHVGNKSFPTRNSCLFPCISNRLPVVLALNSSCRPLFLSWAGLLHDFGMYSSTRTPLIAKRSKVNARSRLDFHSRVSCTSHCVHICPLETTSRAWTTCSVQSGMAVR